MIQGRGESGGLPVAMGDRRPAALAFLCPPAQAGHLGRSAGLVDEHQLCRIEAGLAIAPSLTGRLYIFALLLSSMRRLFLKVMSRFLKNRHTVDETADTLRSARRRSAIPLSEISAVSSTKPRMKASWASSLEPGGLPCLRADLSPVARNHRYHLPAVEIPISNRLAALRVERPAAIASITRLRRSAL